MFGTILGSIGKSLVGGLAGKLFGGKPKAKGVDYVKLRNDAIAAGFNPLTALMAGGGAGYQRDYNPSLSSGGFIAEAMQRGLDTLFNQGSGDDGEATAIRQNQTLTQVRDHIVSSRVPGSFGYQLTSPAPFVIPTVGVRGPVLPSVGATAFSGGDIDWNAPQSESDMGSKTPERPLRAFGRPIYPGGAFSDAEAFETRYGEPASWASGALSLAYDTGANLRDATTRFMHPDAVRMSDGRLYAPYRPKKPKLARPDNYYFPLDGRYGRPTAGASPYSYGY